MGKITPPKKRKDWEDFEATEGVDPLASFREIIPGLRIDLKEKH